MAAKIFFTVCFIVISGYAAIEDYKYRKIPPIIYPLFLLLGVVRLIVQIPTNEHTISAILGLLIGGVPLLIASLLNGENGIGGGDIKMAASAGFFLWATNSILILLLSNLLMLATGFIYALIKKEKFSQIAMPYAPFYAATGIAILIVTNFV